MKRAGTRSEQGKLCLLRFLKHRAEMAALGKNPCQIPAETVNYPLVSEHGLAV